MIHYILCKEGFNVSLKRVQRKISELSLYSITIKNIALIQLKITYIHTTIDGWCYLASVLDLHSKKIIGYAFGKRMTNNLVIKTLKFKRV